MPVAQQLTEPVLHHGEGPVWWPDEYLRCVDLFAGDLVDLTADGTTTRRHVGTIAAAVRPRAGGGAVVAVERGIALLDPDGSVERQPELWSDPSVRMNDGGCDPDGNFYCGSMAYDASPGRGAFYRFGVTGRVDTVLKDVTISNGFAFSPDGTRAYYVDTGTGRIDLFDHDSARGLTERRPFVTVETSDGSPDGICVDSVGGVWVACWGAGSLRYFTSAGTLEEIVTVPGVPNVSACTLGGPGLDHLYITTSREGRPADELGADGAIFVVNGVPAGLPVLPAKL